MQCSSCSKKFCIGCLGLDIHNCPKQDVSLKNARKKLESELIKGDSNFLKIDKI